MQPHPDWLIASGLPAGTGGLMTTRHGGCSPPPFDTFNLQFGTGDAAECVRRNREVLAQAIGATPVFLRQVHGARVVRLGPARGDAGTPPEEADASVTTEPGVACTVLVADCLPVLFAAPGVVGAAHAGWRGLAGGVLEATVAAVCEAGRCRPAEIAAWLGVAISPSRFQVGSDVLAALGGSSVASAGPGAGTRPRRDAPAAGDGPAQDASPAGTDPTHAGNVPGFVPEQPGKWLADLPWLARQRLLALGLERIGGGSGCTVSDPSRFFSYRRDRVTGRMAAAVWIDRRE